MVHSQHYEKCVWGGNMSIIALGEGQFGTLTLASGVHLCVCVGVLEEVLHSMFLCHNKVPQSIGLLSPCLPFPPEFSVEIVHESVNIPGVYRKDSADPAFWNLTDQEEKQ